MDRAPQRMVRMHADCLQIETDVSCHLEAYLVNAQSDNPWALRILLDIEEMTAVVVIESRSSTPHQYHGCLSLLALLLH